MDILGRRQILTLSSILWAIIRGAEGQCALMIQQLNATATAEYLTSPNYPSNYDNNLECGWRLTASNGSLSVRMDTVDSQIESQSSCWYDYFKVYDGENSGSTLLGRHCGKSKPTYVSTGSSLYIYFFTDGSISNKGFKIKYFSGERSSLLDDDENDGPSITLILACSIGGLIGLIIIVSVIVFCISSKTGKPRRTVHPRGIQSNSRSRSQRIRRQQSVNTISMHQYPPGYVDVPTGYSLYDSVDYGGFIPPTSPPPPYSAIDHNSETNTLVSGNIATTSLNSTVTTSAPPLSQQQPQ